jgi:hypothetical protein
MPEEIEIEEQAKGGPMPPYTAFQSLKSALLVLHEHVIPNRIDRSIWGNKFSGSVASQVLTALRFLSLIDQEGVPTEKLRALVQAINTDGWATELRKVIEQAYAPIFALDLQKATASQFYERFRIVYGADGETGRKCVTFFLNAAREAAIPVSPFLLANAKPRATSGTVRRKPKTKKQSSEEADDDEDEVEIPIDPPAPSMTNKLLDKFPEFDPTWPDEIKKQWFSGFTELMDRTKSKGGSE